MASKRQLQVGELIKRNFGHILQQQGSYIYGSAFVTVTKVQATPDLGLAKIYLSIYNVEDKDSVVDAINRNITDLRHQLAFRIKKHVRRIPQINVFRDETLDEMYKLNQIFDQIADGGRGEEE